MRGVKAKALRKRVYGSTDYREREYGAINQKFVYLTGGDKARGWSWGWPFRLWTRIADPKRRGYQRLKRA